MPASWRLCSACCWHSRARRSAAPALQVECRARIAQEGTLAAQSLAYDFGGFLADSPGRTGTLAQYSFTNWDVSQGNVLVLYFQGTTPTDVIAITYQLNGNQLVRTNSSSGVTTTIAKYVTAFSALLNPDNTSQAVDPVHDYLPFVCVHLHADW